MVKTVRNKIHASQSEAGTGGDLRRAPKPPRPDTAVTARHIRLGFPTARRWHSVLKHARERPRSASTALALAELQAELEALAGEDVLDGADFRPVRRRAIGLEVTYPDGSVKNFRQQGRVAKLLGVKPSSLRVMLTQAGGQLARHYRTESGGYATYKVRRIYAGEEVQWG